jgi:uncharacterized protein involved in exopolysaccharide biosynthesis/Mrp family chromosome partitioning ATPase
MQTNDNQLSQPGGLQLGDIYYILFRQKWIILGCAIAGVIAAGVICKTRPALYESRARLLIPYIYETSALISTSGSEAIKPDFLGEGIIDSELQILTSSDLAYEVVDSVGAEKIVRPLPGMSKEALRGRAAGEVMGKLSVNAPKRTMVVFVNFQHADPDTARSVLTDLIDAYRKKHIEVHRSIGDMDEILDRATGELRNSIARLDDELRDLKSTNNIVSIEETKKAQLDQMSKIQRDLMEEEANLAQFMAAFPKMTNQPSVTASNAAATAAAAGLTNRPVGLTPVALVPPVSEAKALEYKLLIGQLEFFLGREQELLKTLTPANFSVQEYHRKVAEVQEAKAKMEKEEPGLVKEEAMLATSGTSTEPGMKFDLRAESHRVAGTQAKIAVLKKQWETMRASASAVEAVETKIRDLTRRKEVLEEQYKTASARLERSRQERLLNASKLSSIKVIQAPTAPGKDYTKLYKRMGAAIGGGLGLGIALAFLIELVLDQSIRRGADLQKKLRMPVFVTVPRLPKLRAQAQANLPSTARPALTAGNGSKGNGAPAPNPASLLPALQSIAATSNVVEPYCDALRDRLIHYFQKNNMTHKPKLVAVTGCSDGAGVSTVAAGLAASLSETGDGNVLLVDTNVAEGAAHPFYRGKLACGLNDVLKEELRGGAQVQDNLYVAAASDSDGALIKALPKRFSQLVPKLKASDYDYIIFDMPPVSQTSITSKLAGFMDMVLLVVESERTGRGVVAEATDLLRDSRANVAAVLNKNRRFVPRWLHREFE